MSTDGGEEEVRAGLQALIGSHHPSHPPRLSGFRRLAAGLSRESWAFECEQGGGGRAGATPMILRRDPPASLLDTDRVTEFALLERLAPSGLPSPGVLWLDATGEHLGRPAMVMVRAPGESDWMLLNGDLSLSARRDLAGAYVDLLAQVHAVDWRGLGIDEVTPDPGAGAPAHELGVWEAQLRSLAVDDLPEVELALSWLRATAPVSQATVLVHGDYKPGNLLVHRGRISALLDWELAHLGDPLEDLGWVTNPLRAREQQIPEVWGRDEIVARYTARRGIEVGAGELTWWNVFSCFKLAVIVQRGIAAFQSGCYDLVPQEPTVVHRAMLRLIEGVEG